MTDRRPSTDERVDRYLTGSGAGTHLLGLGMDGLIARWEAIADEVAAGYRLGLDDYLNDLDLRQILDGAVAAVAETRGPLLARLRSADARFRAATRPVDDSLWGAAAPGDRHRTWWYFRVPLRASGEMAEDLAARDI